MKIVIDLDNTLTDEFGNTKRPEVDKFLMKLIKDKHELILWTNSTSQRAKKILYDHNLKQYFSKFIFREDYDPENKGLNKNIVLVNADLIIDDDPDEIQFAKNMGRNGILVKSYRKNSQIEPDELNKVYEKICNIK